MNNRKKVVLFFFIFTAVSGWLVWSAWGYFSLENTVQLVSKIPRYGFRDINDNEVTLDKYKGKEILVIFVDFDCGSCQALYDSAVVGADNSRIGSVHVIFIATNSISFMPLSLPQKYDERIPLLFDRQRHFYKKMGIGRTPACLLIDKEGAIVEITLGKEALDRAAGVINGKT